MTRDPVGAWVSLRLLVQRQGKHAGGGCAGPVSSQSPAKSGGTVAADRQACAFAGVPVSVVDEEAGRAGELVSLLRHDPHRELLPGQVRPRAARSPPRCPSPRHRPPGTAPRGVAPAVPPRSLRSPRRTRRLVERRSQLPSLHPCLAHRAGHRCRRPLVQESVLLHIPAGVPVCAAVHRVCLHNAR